MANWQMHSVGELGAKSYVAREKLNAAAFSAFLMDPDINNPVRHLLVWGFIAIDSSSCRYNFKVPGVIISGEAGKGKSYLMKLVENMLHKGQVRTVHRASACSKDEGMFLVLTLGIV